MGNGKKIPKAVAKKFYSGKTTLEVLKKKREIAAHQKSKMLRDFAKLCKKEGIESDRVNLDGVPKTKNPKEKGSVPVQQRKLQNSKDQQNGLKSIDEINVGGSSKRDAVESSKSTNRKNTMNRQRTKKGQPVLNNQIKSILTKLTASSSAGSS